MAGAFRHICFVLVAFWSNSLMAQEVDDIAGRVVGHVDGREVELPMLRSEFDIDIQGDMATVRLTQEFSNPSDIAMSAEYLFPLNQAAAIYAMEMRVGDEVVQAVIQRKEEAEATFETAEAEGKAAALLTQHRPNMFTQNIANLMPGMPITVTLSYVQSVPKIDGAYELVVPLIVGPRYEGAGEYDAPADEPEMQVVDGWSVSPVPAYPMVAGLDLPSEIATDRVSLDLSITGAAPVASVTSATHRLTLEDRDGATIARFSEGRVIDNRDLVVRYMLGGDEIAAGVLSHYDERGGIVSLMIEPPRAPEDSQAIPRELVFVLDTSGSMGGAPIAASKRFMESALKALRPNDYFRVIRFANGASHFSDAAVPATEVNRRAGLRFVRGLSAGGGTEIDNAIRTAFATQQPENTLRIVVFLSDGYIGNEAKVLRSIRGMIGDARIYAFGVGTSVNRYLLDAMAEEGRGYARYVDPTESDTEAAEALARDLRTPLLTDISIDWGGLDVTDVTPAKIPDLFDGNSVRVFARYRTGGPAEIKVNGLVQGRRAALPVALELPSTPVSNPEETEAIPLVWARERIADLDRAIAVGEGSPKTHEATITDLGLRYSLQTRYTSFVAVSERVVNDTGQSMSAAVPLPMVAGVEATAYPSGGFSGTSTPEPETLFGLVTLAALGAVRFARRRRA